MLRVLISFLFWPITPSLSPTRWLYEPEAGTHDSPIPVLRRRIYDIPKFQFLALVRLTFSCYRQLTANHIQATFFWLTRQLLS